MRNTDVSAFSHYNTTAVSIMHQATGSTGGGSPVLSEAAVCGDTEHLGVDVLQGELFCRDCIDFILQRAQGVF